MYTIVFLLGLVSSFSVLLEPFQSTPHIKLCNLYRDCEELLLVLDTGSPDLWLSDSSCDNCPERSVRCLSTSNFKSPEEHTSGLVPKEIHYGIGWVKGYEIDYKICGIVTKVLCVTNARDVMHYRSHGVIGIGGNSTGKEFMLKLMHSLNVSSSLSLFFGSYFTQLTVGGLNEEYVKTGSSLVYFQTSPEWTLRVSSLKIDNMTLSEGILGMIDTGSSLLVVPQAIFDKILHEIHYRVSEKCMAKAHGIQCPCPSPTSMNLFPTLSLSLKGADGLNHSFTLPPQSYVSLGKHKCTAEITSLKVQSLSRIIILGSPFMRQYITTFDFEKQLIGIIESDRDRIHQSETNNLTLLTVTVALFVIVLARAVLHIIDKYYQKEGRLVI